MSGDGVRRRPGKGAGTEAATSQDPAAEPVEATPAPPASAKNSEIKQNAEAAEVPCHLKPSFLECHEDKIPILILLVLGFVRFYRLDLPAGVVFDESHFGRFTNQYTAGTYFFDIHPPLGKLVFYAVGRLVGYDHTVCGYANIEDQYSPTCKYYWIRATAAFFGTLTGPIIYQTTRYLGGSVLAGLLATLFFTFDGLNSVESRLILIDSQLVFWCAASLWIGMKWFLRYNAHVDAVEEHWTPVAKRDLGYMESLTFNSSLNKEHEDIALAKLKADPRTFQVKTRIMWIFLIAIFCANAFSVKFTGLAAPGIVALESLFAIFFLKRAYWFPDLLGIATVAFFVFSSYWYIHFSILPLTGDGDVFMPVEFQRTLINNTHYDPNAPKTPFWQTMIDLNIDMVRSSDGITERHHWESVWYEWIFNIRGLAYYSHSIEHTYTQAVYLLGNPMVIWGAFVSIVVSMVLGLFYYRYKHEDAGAWNFSSSPSVRKFFVSVVFCFLMYWLNLLPYLKVSRSCFIYHYMPALYFAEMLMALLIDQLSGRKYMKYTFTVVAAVVVGTFLFYAPWIYAFPLTSEGHQRRRWLPRWD